MTLPLSAGFHFDRLSHICASERDVQSLALTAISTPRAQSNGDVRHNPDAGFGTGPRRPLRARPRKVSEGRRRFIARVRRRAALGDPGLTKWVSRILGS